MNMFQIKKIVDLSIDINEDTLVYPGDPHPSFKPMATIDKDGYNILQVCMGSQSGTHADAPYHFSEEGKTIEQCDLRLFTGMGIVVPVLGKQPHQPITLTDVEPYLKKMHEGMIVVFHTGWSQYNKTEQYFTHPYLALETVQAVLDRGVRTIAVDMINIDDTGTNEYPAHHLIVKHDGVIIENLTNLAAIDFPEPFFSFLPLKMTNADGAPIRAVAMDLTNTNRF